jgi:8-oxo-dGTP pyrophosphatase MutT (NUDIX family)
VHGLRATLCADAAQRVSALPGTVPRVSVVEDGSLIELAVSLLVDRRGWVLLQERDENAVVAPDQWGFVGGHVEPGESTETAAYRELAEETGLDWSGGLELWSDEIETNPRTGQRKRWSIWTAAVDLTDADIVVGEGRKIVFVDPALVLTFDLGGTARPLLERFLASDRYAELVESAERLAVNGAVAGA